MAQPTPDWDEVTVRWAGRLIDGSPAQGELVFTADASRWLDDDPVQSISIFNVPIRVPIGPDGTVNTPLPVTDDPDISTNDFTWTCTENLVRGVGGSYTFTAPRSAITDGIDLNRIVEVGPSSGTPVAPVTRAEFEALFYTFVRLDQVAIALDEDGVPYWGNIGVDLTEALPVRTDTDGVPYVVAEG